MKKEKSDSRQAKLDDGQMYEGFEFKGRKHRPLTGGALKFLQRIGSALYDNNFEGCSELDVVLEYLYATSATPTEMCKAIDNWETVQFEFADQYTAKDLIDPIIIQSMMRDIANQTAATFEIETSEDSKKE